MNHRVYKRAVESILNKPKNYDAGQRWIRTEVGVLEPMCSCVTVFPNSLVAHLNTGDREEEEEEEEFDFDDFSESDGE